MGVLHSMKVVRATTKGIIFIVVIIISLIFCFFYLFILSHHGNDYQGQTVPNIRHVIVSCEIVLKLN